MSAEVAKGFVGYAVQPDGTRRYGLEIDGVRVLVEPHEDGKRVATMLVANSEILRRLHEQLTEARSEAERLRGQIPPKRPVALLGTGCVRQDPDPSNPALWVLNNRARGFGEFGFRVDGWDDLFRRFDVVVTGFGTDTHGAYWTVEPRKGSGT